MLYKTEILVNKRVLATLQGEATNPQQAVRRVLNIAERKQQKPDYMTIYVMNERGETWIYAVRKKGEAYYAMLTHRSKRILPKNIVLGVFSGNVHLSEVM